MFSCEIGYGTDFPFFLSSRSRFYVFFMIGYFAFIVIWVIVDVGLKNPENLLSAAGVAIFILLFYIFSHNPAAVRALCLHFRFCVCLCAWLVCFYLIVLRFVTEYFTYATGAASVLLERSRDRPSHLPQKRHPAVPGLELTSTALTRKLLGLLIALPLKPPRPRSYTFLH